MPSALTLNTAPSTNTNEPKAYPCPFCEMSFDKFQSLGGHKSKSHPNSSVAYTKKKEVRARREECRNQLAKAKYIFYERYPELTSHLQHRDKLNDIKKKL